LSFNKFTKIGKLSDVVYRMRKYYPEVTYITVRGKIKIHGQNGGIRFTETGIFAQNRTGDVIVGGDNRGFALWVETMAKSVSVSITSLGFTVYGEWAGAKINKGTAVCRLPKKTFFIFAIQSGDTYIVEPLLIKSFLKAMTGIEVDGRDDIQVIPWHTQPMYLPLAVESAYSLQAVVDTMSAYVEKVDKEDPYIKKLYGIEGPGEGLVFTAIGLKESDYHGYSDTIFKVKGTSHTKKERYVPEPIDPVTLKANKDFAKHFTTEQRMLQTMDETKVTYEMVNMGAFLKWLLTDILEESITEREVNKDLHDWKKLNKYCSRIAVKWFKSKCA